MKGLIKMIDEKIIEQLVKKTNEQSQFIIAIEEMSELTKVLCKIQRYEINQEVFDSLIEEFTHVKFCLDVLAYIFDLNNECNQNKINKEFGRKIDIINKYLNEG
jgi:uncharacterized protein YabN with tetrapyrrole methylase and pyrophosphatase domain